MFFLCPVWNLRYPVFITNQLPQQQILLMLNPLLKQAASKLNAHIGLKGTCDAINRQAGMPQMESEYSRDCKVKTRLLFVPCTQKCGLFDTRGI